MMQLMFVPADSFLNEGVSVGIFLSFQIILLLVVYLYFSTRRDVEMKVLQEAVNEIAELGKDHEHRIQIAETTLARVVLLQESMDKHMEGIDERHKQMDMERRSQR